VLSAERTPKIDVSFGADEAVCRIVGDVDVAALSALQRVLRALPGDGCTSVVFDCIALTFLDVGGARALSDRTSELRAAGIIVEIRGMSGVAQRVLRFVSGDEDV
jgi:anti-anti-sigma regulatory factor